MINMEDSGRDKPGSIFYLINVSKCREPLALLWTTQAHTGTVRQFGYSLNSTDELKCHIQLGLNCLCVGCRMSLLHAMLNLISLAPVISIPLHAGLIADKN